MKRRLVVIIGILIFGLLGWMGYTSASSLKKREEKKELVQSLDSMYKNLGLESDSRQGTTMLVYFNSECEHCQWEIEEMGKSFEKFGNVNLAFVSLEPTDSARNFLSKHSLQDYFIETKPENIMATFSEGVPQIFVYEGGALKNQFKGEVKMEVLLEALN